MVTRVSLYGTSILCLSKIKSQYTPMEIFITIELVVKTLCMYEQLM